MGLLPALGIILTSIIVAASTMGTIKYHYQRETTDIEEKYINRDADEIDTLYHQSYYPTDGTLALSINGSDGSYSDNIIPISTAQPNENLYIGPSDYDGDGVTDRDEIKLGTNPYKPDPLPPGYRKPDDWDDDGLSNNDEEMLGTQPDNPDSDGDGIIDSQDPMPNDPNIGGAIIPPELPSNEDIGDKLKVILSKAACNPNLTESGACDKDEYWKFDQIDADFGDILRFKLSIEVENTSGGDVRVNLFELLPTELKYEYSPGDPRYPERANAAVQINKNLIHIFTNIEDDWLHESYRSYPLTIRSGQTKIYTIWFNATLKVNPTPESPVVNQADIILPGGKSLASDSITIK